MGAVEGGCAELVAQVDAYYKGEGDPVALLGALRDATLLLPVLADGRVARRRFGGARWVCVFTGEDEFALYAAARRGGAKLGRFDRVVGADLLDGLAGIVGRERPRGWRAGVLRALVSGSRAGATVGIAVDIAGATPTAFPTLSA